MRFLFNVALVAAIPIVLVLYFLGGQQPDEPASGGRTNADVGGLSRPAPRNGATTAGPTTPAAEEDPIPPRMDVNRGERGGFERRLNSSIPLYVQLVPYDKQEVPSERDGQLIVIGTEIAPGEEVAPERRFSATIGYLIIPVGKDDQVSPSEVIRGGKDSRWRRWKLASDDAPEPGRVYVNRLVKWYKRLEVGDEVKAGQTVALVDPSLALTDLMVKQAGLDAAESERRASVKTKEEAERRVASMEESMRRVPGSVSKDDYEGAKLTARRYLEEEIAKRSAVVKAQQELIQAQTILTKHEIHASISGVIKILYKNRGDAVKNLDAVMQIQSGNPLKAEGLIDVQEIARIHPGKTEVIVEPARQIPPRLVLEGHLGEVTCVAVSRGKEPVIVSGAEDQTLRGWNATTGQQMWRLTHRSTVRSVACTGPKAARNLALAGCSDGAARIIDLDELDACIKDKNKPQPDLLPLKGRHRGAVHCVAFSPDGKTCATGGEDRRILLWNAETGELRCELPSYHRAPVSSLQFTVRNQLISAAHDNTLAVWTWSTDEGSHPARLTEFDHRGGDVTQLGASPDGKQVLFDQGRDIKLLSIDSRQVEGVFRNVSGTNSFTTLALFDPDGLTVLTSGASEGRLQLWRTPTGESARATELRQLAWGRGNATSAAFSPDGSFCVTGMSDRHVLVWQMPARQRNGDKVELVEAPIRSKIKKVDEFIDSSNRQVHIWADVDNKDHRLLPGNTATMVVLPDDK